MNHLDPTPIIFTIGHSTRRVEEFLQLLDAPGVARVVDVRTVPRSRHNPQYNADFLPGTLQEAGIAYEHCRALGGWRKARADSVNTAWREPSFRGYADYMQTAEFWTALEELLEKARGERLALLCAEAVPWSCHRRLIGDALLVRGAEVQHILSTTRLEEHTLTPWGVIEDGRITYPGPPPPAEAAL
jgi:uncharacterized protein (DUF488 family)